MATRNSIIKDALLLLEVKDPDQAVTNQEIADGVRLLNDYLRVLEASVPMPAVPVRGTFALATAQQNFTIAASGTPDVTAARPVEFLGANLKKTSTGDETPLLLMTESEHFAVKNKATEGFPRRVRYLAGEDYGTISVSPPIGGTGYTVEYRALAPITDFGTATATDSASALPDTWNLVLSHGLAGLMGPGYGKTELGEVLGAKALTLAQALAKQGIR